VKPVSFGSYTLLRRLAGGGMAELYLARVRGPAGAGRLAVVKLLSSRLAEERAMRDMFRDEVRIAATLHHPNIGQVFEAGTIDGQYFLALEYIHGQDLRAVVNACRSHGHPGVPTPIAIYLGTKVCAALQHAHEARGLDGQALGIVHRDVSPSNIMVNFDGDVKLLDFGIARLAKRSAMTNPGFVKGKVRYLTPEQLLGRPVDHRTDIFMLGISLWEATVGEHLFAGEHENEVFRQICHGEVRRPSSLVRGYPAALEAVVLRALAFEPEQRFASARSLHAELVRVAERQGLTLSELRAAELMREVFAQEVTAWDEAQRRGVSLLDHLLATIPEQPAEGENPLTLNDQLITTPPAGARPTPAPAPAAQPSPHSAVEGGERRQTVLFGARGSRLPFATAPTTSASPADRAGGSLAQSSPAAPPRGSRPLRVSGEAVVAITPEGQAELLSGAALGLPAAHPAAAPTSPGERPRLLVPDDDDAHPTLLDPVPAYALPADPAAHAVALAAATGPGAQPGGDPHPLAGVAASGPAPARLGRVATGDWSNRSRPEGRRPGTHPYFRERKTPLGSLLVPRGRGPGAPTAAPRRSRVVATAVVLTGIALGSGALLALTHGWLRQPRGDRAAAPAPPPHASHSLVRLTSAPSGATVYRARDGVELGSTPLVLERAAARGLRVELHRPGYEIMALTLAAESAAIHVELRPKPPRPPDRPTP